MLGNALSLVYPKMMFVMVLGPRDIILRSPWGELHLLLRQAMICLRQFYSAWESWQIWSSNFFSCCLHLPTPQLLLLINSLNTAI